MAELTASERRTRDRLVDAAQALRLHLRGIESVRDNILNPIDKIAQQYEHVEAYRVRDAVYDINTAIQNLESTIQSCVEGARVIAEQE